MEISNLPVINVLDSSESRIFGGGGGLGVGGGGGFGGVGQIVRGVL